MLPVPPILMRWQAPPSSPNRPGSASWSWRRSGSRPAHRDRRSVGARAAGGGGFRPLPWRAQPRPLVRAVLGPRPAALAVFVPEGPVVVGIDETIERRWGPKISARGIYRDPVRSSHGHFVKTSGLRWISVMLLVHIPGRIWGLPFLTTLAPSERFARLAGATSRWPTPVAASGQPLAARSPAHCRGRHHLCRHRAARSTTPQAHHGHPSAPGRPAVRSATPARHQRPGHRPAPADPCAAAG
jgi:hypothetical protein